MGLTSNEGNCVTVTLSGFGVSPGIGGRLCISTFLMRKYITYPCIVLWYKNSVRLGIQPLFTSSCKSDRCRAVRIRCASSLSRASGNALTAITTSVGSLPNLSSILSQQHLTLAYPESFLSAFLESFLDSFLESFLESFRVLSRVPAVVNIQLQSSPSPLPPLYVQATRPR